MRRVLVMSLALIVFLVAAATSSADDLTTATLTVGRSDTGFRRAIEATAALLVIQDDGVSQIHLGESVQNIAVPPRGSRLGVDFSSAPGFPRIDSCETEADNTDSNGTTWDRRIAVHVSLSESSRIPYRVRLFRMNPERDFGVQAVGKIEFSESMAAKASAGGYEVGPLAATKTPGVLHACKAALSLYLLTGEGPGTIWLEDGFLESDFAAFGTRFKTPILLPTKINYLRAYPFMGTCSVLSREEDGDAVHLIVGVGYRPNIASSEAVWVALTLGKNSSLSIDHVCVGSVS